MHDLLGGASGERLTLDAYLDDYEKKFWAITDHGFWKLERQQTFKEPGFDSWEAFAAGRWTEALRLIESERTEFEEYFGRLAEHEITFRRVRVVEEPIAPYLQWELHVLRLREHCGEQIRVVSPEQISALEKDETLPELITLGSTTLYQICYNEQGVLEGAIRFTDHETISRCRQTVEELYTSGERLSTFFDRAVAGLEPPASQ